MLIVSPNPHIHTPLSTRRIMLDVVIALLPATLVSILFYGYSSLILFAVSCLGCVGLEWLICRFILKIPSTVGDLSALVTGLLIGLNLPPACPWWVALVGCIVAIGVAKASFGGLGQNIFNPAIVARVFLLISFPVAMTSWNVPTTFIAVDSFTGATPLSLINEGLRSGQTVPQILSMAGYSPANALFASMGGSAGEISALALLAGFVYLLIRKVIKPYITLTIWATVTLFSAIMHGVNPDVYTGPLFNLLTGGLLLGSIFMATDYVTSPMSNLGGVVFGFGIGLVTMLIRYWGSYPEGMSFAILLMNACVPLINSAFKKRKFGRK